MSKWISIILQLILFLIGGYFILEYTNWTFLIGLIIFMWGNNLMVAENYKEYFDRRSHKNT